MAFVVGVADVMEHVFGSTKSFGCASMNACSCIDPSSIFGNPKVEPGLSGVGTRRGWPRVETFPQIPKKFSGFVWINPLKSVLKSTQNVSQTKYNGSI